MSFQIMRFVSLLFAAFSFFSAPCFASALNPRSICEAELLNFDPEPIQSGLLSAVSRKDGSFGIESHSDQRGPVHVGLSPLEQARGSKPKTKPELLDSLRELGQNQAERVLWALKRETAEFEAWPTVNDVGEFTWVFARWRVDAESPWHWLDETKLKLKKKENRNDPPIFLPKLVDPQNEAAFKTIFSDFLDLNSLYEKPLFSDGIWTTADGAQTIGAWLPVDSLVSFRKFYTHHADQGLIFHNLPQPAHFNGQPMSFILPVHSNQIQWPSQIEWVASQKAPEQDFTRPPKPALVKSWDADFEKKFLRDIVMLDGEDHAIFPETGVTVDFKRKSSADPLNQLGDMVEYFSQRYRALGLEVRVQAFEWRGIKQYNVIGVIKGSLQGEANHPVVMADHYDTAYAQRVFDDTGERVSVPGADDNVSGSATLLRAAEALKDSKPLHDIYLLHLTGEEFPADDLGARYFIQDLLKSKITLSGILLLDMIGYRAENEHVFQINPSDSAASLAIAAEALDAGRIHAQGFKPKLRLRYDQKSYLYNTDGRVFEDAGLPVILFNEHINRHHHLDRDGYHEANDTVDKVDVAYASAIARVAIETAARLSMKTQ